MVQFTSVIEQFREEPPNTACTGRLGLARFLELFLNFGSFPFPSLSLPSRQ